MKILIAPDSFKDCLTAKGVAVAIEKGIRRVLPKAKCVRLPMADGGEGTIDAILNVRHGRKIHRTVPGPLGRKVRAGYGLLKNNKTAVVEMAAASGLMLVAPGKRNPLLTSSYGTGELIADAMARGAKEIIVGLGGSATVDGGAGMAQALGIRFRDRHGKVIRKKMTGALLDQIEAIDMDKINLVIGKIKITVAVDVDNTLCGRFGAARVFGPQKGATPAMVKQLENNLRHLAVVIKRDLDINVMKIKGGGAAGGLGAGMVAFTGAELTGGAELVADMIGFKKQARGVDLIITGEGRIDAQIRHGKVVAGVAEIGKRLGVPVVAIGGSVADDINDLYNYGLVAVTSTVTRDMELDDAIQHSRKYIANAAERMLHLFL